MNRQDYEQLDTGSRSIFANRTIWVSALIALPIMVYVFIVLPMYSPPLVELPSLVKYDVWEPQHERLILVGDVHGCFDQLMELLDTVHYDNTTDKVLLLGDFLSRGPDSLGVMKWAREANATGVLGNHELNILSKYQSFRPLMFEDEEMFKLDKHVGKYDNELQIARKLTPEDIHYLVRLPVVLNIKGVGICSHMGVVESQPLDKQQVSDLLAMDKDWYHSWNQLQKTLPKNERNVIYYGHFARAGLQLKKYSKGLDSSCVYGGQLSCLVIDKDGTETLHQVDC